MKGILFDFDYTLVDSSRGVVKCARKTLKEMGYKRRDNTKMKKSIGMTLQDTFQYLTGNPSISEAERYKDNYIKNADDIITKNTKWLHNVKEEIDLLKKRNIKLGVVSTKLRRRIQEFLKREKFLDRFDIIIGGEDVSNHKPDPEGLLKAIRLLNLDPNKTFYIGDSIIDQNTAYIANIQFIASLTGITTEDEFDKGKVKYFIKNLREVEDIT